MRSSELGLLGLGAVCILAISVNAGGCQSEDDGTVPTGAGSTGTGGRGGGTGDGGSGAGTTSSSGTAGGGSGGGGGSGEPVVTIRDITTQTGVGLGTPIQVKGVVAMSRKFLVSKSSSSGSCLWGVFFSEPGLDETAANTGILAVSFGTQATTDNQGNTNCPVLSQGPVGDAFPDDIAPGDVLDLVGKTSYFTLDACADTCGDTVCAAPETAQSCKEDCGTTPNIIAESTIAEYQISNVIQATKTGTAPVPAPHVLTAEEVAKLSSPTDTEFHDAWGGVKVRVEGEYAPRLQTTTMGQPTVVGAFGNIYLESGPVQIGDKIYFVKDSANGCEKGPSYADPSLVFSTIDGFSYKNFCTWSLQPSNKCADFVPHGSDCEAGLMCP